jgi:hypothetical protein
MWGSICMVTMLGVALASMGCGGDKTGGDKGGGSPKPSASSGDNKGGAPKGERSGIVPTGWATLKGRVTFEGTPPAVKDVDLVDAAGKPNANADYCKKGDIRNPLWMIDATKGVKNVVVWIKPPAGKFFEIPADQQKPEQAVVKVDQPFCAFEPHVSILFPSFYDAASKKQKSTGQTFEVVNSATITHNTNWTPTNSAINTGNNKMLPPKAEEKIDFKASREDRPSGEDLISLKCNIHPWMTGYVWAFDHPYAAVTKADGSYEIKNVPAGAELDVVAWHEPDMYVLPEGKGSKQGQKLEALKDKETKELIFKISAQ